MKWVKIQDQLPPVQRTIMVYHVTGGIITIYYSLMHKETDLNGWVNKGISHWMEMPLPPTF